MKKRDEIIADAIAGAVETAKAEADALESGCAQLIARRDSLQAEIDSVNASIEQANKDIEESRQLIKELQDESATASERAIKR